MRRKLLRPWARLPLQTLTEALPPSPTHLLLFRSAKHSSSPSQGAYDPPFTPRPKKQPPNSKTPTKTLDSKRDKNLPRQSDLPFDFRYSYSETDPSITPIGFREPPSFSPFGPGRLDREWTGVSAPVKGELELERVLEERRAVLGDPLTEEEIEELVELYRHNDCSRQINLGN